MGLFLYEDLKISDAVSIFWWINDPLTILIFPPNTSVEQRKVK
jgi:hypothetical protein